MIILFTLFSSSLCSLLASEMFILLFRKIAKSRKKIWRRMRTTEKMASLVWRKIYKCLDCTTVTGYLLLKSLKREEKYYKWAKKNKGNKHTREKNLTTPTAFRGARNHLNNRFVAFWVNHTQASFFIILLCIYVYNQAAERENLDTFHSLIYGILHVMPALFYSLCRQLRKNVKMWDTI